MARTTNAAAVTSIAGMRVLAENGTMRFPRRRRAAMVRIERGTVLVTQKGDLQDHVLEPGDEIVLAAGGLAVAWAFTDATISVREAESSGTPRRPMGDDAREVTT